MPARIPDETLDKIQIQLQNDPTISNLKLSKEYGLSAPTIAKYRRAWGIDNPHVALRIDGKVISSHVSTDDFESIRSQIYQRIQMLPVNQDTVEALAFTNDILGIVA